MTVMASDSAIRRLLFRSPSLTKALRLGVALKQHIRAQVHDPDFHCLKVLPAATGLALDIGANNGKSAVSILAIKPQFSVVCIEPNPSCAAALKLHARLYGDRMRYIHAGAAEAVGTLPFFVPVRNGRQLIEEGTFDMDALRSAEWRLGKNGVDYKIEVLTCPVIVVDDLNLSPAFVKIDVQGYEVNVLRGMVKTIARSRPLILLEDGKTTPAVVEFMEPMGYRQKFWRDEGLTDKPSGTPNFVMVPMD